MNPQEHQEQVHTAVKGVVGMATSGVGTWISFFTEVELFLRIMSLVVGISVGIVTCWSIWSKTKERRKK